MNLILIMSMARNMNKAINCWAVIQSKTTQRKNECTQGKAGRVVGENGTHFM